MNDNTARRSIFVRLRATLAAFAVLCVLCAAGCCCCGYHIGPEGLYHSQIKTVFVPMVEADTYREAFAERLTEAICKKITEQTPYRLATVDVADTVLSVRLTSENQTVSAFNRYNDTRQKDVKLAASATWTYNKGDFIDGPGGSIASKPSAGVRKQGASITSQSYLVPEMGQSTATAQQEAIDKLAAEIVGLMEAPW